MCASLLIAGAVSAPAQTSPPAIASLAIGERAVSIRYSAPSVRGRQIFGDKGLVSKDSTYPVWRAGANAATAFHTDADLTIGGLAVPKGDYTLFVLVRDSDAWELIINTQAGQWGLTYDATQDLGRVKMTMTKPPALIETLRYVLSDRGGGNAELRLEWEQHIGTVPIVVR
ncbi:MAG: DUF2911 domain-containing protein [Acidobacteria bacterium]|nr:DUF2911 domain-containing protein [Acidobacteriota bacterium]